MIDFNRGVKLAALNRDDISLALKWRNNPAIYKWCRQSDVISDASQEDWFDRQRKDSSIKMWVIWANERVGVCGLTSIDMLCRRAEFSLYVGPEYKGNRYGEKALATMLDHGFQSLGLNVIWGETFAGNPALRTFERLGFTQEGLRRQFYFKGGQFIDAHLISMTAKEWADAGSSDQRGGRVSRGGGTWIVERLDRAPEAAIKPGWPPPPDTTATAG